MIFDISRACQPPSTLPYDHVQDLASTYVDPLNEGIETLLIVLLPQLEDVDTPLRRHAMLGPLLCAGSHDAE